MRQISILLNSGWSGPHAGFALAEDDGHLAAEGIAVDWRGGRGAGASVEDMQGCDFAYGDLTVLIARLGRELPETGPKAVFVAFGETPLTIAVANDGHVKTLPDLKGWRVTGHARDAALIVFPVAADAAGLDTASVTIEANPAPLAAQIRAMVEHGTAEGVFGFVNTMLAGLEAAGLEHLTRRIRFLRYADLVPELAGNALIASRAMLAEPDVIHALLRGVSRGFAAAMSDPARGVASVAKRASIHLSAETRRWERTIAAEMAQPDAARFGLGGMDPERLDDACMAVAEAMHLRRVRAPEVFDDSFLPR